MLVSGDEKIIAEVRDPSDAGSFEQINYLLVTEAPVVEIVSPIPNGRYYSDQPILFSALISDMEDDLEDLVSSWSSSLDGELNLDTAPSMKDNFG